MTHHRREIIFIIDARTWDDLTRVGYTAKECMTCEWKGTPDQDAAPCHQLWADKTGYPSAHSMDGPVYWPSEENKL